MEGHRVFTVALVTFAIGCRESAPTESSAARRLGDGSVAAATAATQRPISDFLNVQGTFCVPDGSGGCLLFDPPVPNLLTWRSESGICVFIDYAGVAKAWLEQASNGTVSLPTSITGTITEQLRDDGAAWVHVRLHTRNALAWAGECSSGGQMYMGYKAPEVLAGAQPAFGESVLRLVFVNHAPGARLPDLFKMLVLPEPTQELAELAFSATANGPLHAAFGVTEGTPGMAQIILVSQSRTSSPNAGIPIAQVELRPLGR